ncbi:hypothetical protein GA0070609_6418 [Micromonospora echinaurantiaca]|uniref:Uncharacterized protein n=1 Tax=Micromonospora echinaurantiaca TaxID=47857 RepID=A0A1C5KCF6_9ACTN|nr:hypothetical protein [Micromonospora echinaurantiaca]SCG80404.1 hypothetical protein GA0070609_6418 [Micromonospora echinaurantiaca]
MWVTWSFGYALLAMPVFVVLGLVAQLSGSARVKRVAEIVVLSATAALAAPLAATAGGDPVQWGLVVLLGVAFVVGSVLHVRSYSRSS